MKQRNDNPDVPYGTLQISCLPQMVQLAHASGDALLLVVTVVAYDLVELCGDAEQIPSLTRGATRHTRRDALLLVETVAVWYLITWCEGAILHAHRHHADLILAWGAALHTRGNALLLESSCSL